MFKLLAILTGQMPMFQNGIGNNSVPSAQAYTFNAPSGYAGDISRQLETNVEPAMLIAISSVYPTAFGVAVLYTPGGVGVVGSGFTASQFAGVLIRAVPQQSGNQTDDSAAPPAGGTPDPAFPHGLMVRGYATVICGYGTPARGGSVYVRVVATSNNETVGTFDATGDSTNNVVLSFAQASWASDGKDSNNIAEIRLAM